MAAPNLTGLDKDSAKAGAEVRLAGSGFGAATQQSAVYFRLPDAGATRVAAAVLEWKPDFVRATVPPPASLGGGGPLVVSAASKDGESNTRPFVLLEDTPPSIGTIAPGRGLAGDEVTIGGARFGRLSPESLVAFTAPGPRLVAAEILSWAPDHVRVKVPPLHPDLGGGGPRPVVVRTAWGDSEPQPFLVGELPAITGVNPDQPRPGGRVAIAGRAFGAGPGQLKVIPVFDEDVGGGGQAFEITPVIESWCEESITILLPDHRSIPSTGAKAIMITTEWGASKPEALLIQARSSVTVWTRLEAHARTDDLQEGLRLGTAAAVDDAAWMLGRQWQMFEFQGEDAGSPVSVRVDGDYSGLARWRPDAQHDAPLPPGTPLETVVERERVIPPLGQTTMPFTDLRLAAELGFQFIRHLGTRLRDRELDKYRRWFVERYGIETPPPDVALDADTRRFVAVAAGRAPHGGRIYKDFQGVLATPPQLPKKSPFGGGDRDDAVAAIRVWYAWCERLFSQRNGTQPSAWQAERMEYSFAVTAGDALLEAPEFDGGHLDWYSFNRLPAQVDDGQPLPFTRTVLPNLVTYPGMPAARWWEMELAAVDFGALAVGASELLTLLFVEFGLAYGNDWFAVPVEGLSAGSLCRIARVTVTDSFGRDLDLAPFGDGAGSDWRMFELSSPATTDTGDVLLIPDTLPTTLSSRPSEEILLVRDELANLAWAVERVVESATGRPLDRQLDEQDRRRRAELADGNEATGDAAVTPLPYSLQTLPPSNWYPLIPHDELDDAGELASRRLARGALVSEENDLPISPAGQLLEPGRPLDLYDEEVPRSGARVVREWRLARAPDGTMHLWRTRRKGVGRGEGSSGLRFDTIGGA